MYCKNCGNEIVEGARFCSYCGSPVQEAPQPEPAAAYEEPVSKHVEKTPKQPAPTIDVTHDAVQEDSYHEPKKAVFEEINWNVEDYPNRNTVEKTEDINFNWNANPRDIPDSPKRNVGPQSVKEPAGEVLKGDDLEKAVFGEIQSDETPENMSAADRIDKFYTFNKKNEEFQQLLDREYRKVKSGNAIQHEISKAAALADERFETRNEHSTMEDFLESEGIVKPYQPKEFESDVLQRIEAQENEREIKRMEEEARLAAIEQARLEAEAQKKAEEEAARLAEIARRKAEEEAIAAEQAKIKAREEARLRAEEEARLRAEEEARLRAEAEAKVKAEEEARIKAEADLKAAREAARIKAQQEARLAAEAEARFKAEQQRRDLAAQEAQKKLEEERKRLSAEANQAVAKEEVRRVLEQTARMQKEEEAKIRAAVAGIKLGNKSGDTSGITGTGSISRNEVEEAHRATKNQIDEMAKARDAFFAEFEEEKPLVTGRDTMLSSGDMGHTRIVDKKAILSGLEDATRVMPHEEMKPAAGVGSDDDFFKSLGEENMVNVSGENDSKADPMDFKQEEHDELDDLLSQFESINDIEDVQSTPQNENPGLDDTVIMPTDDGVNGAVQNDFENYGNEEAANYINQQSGQYDGGQAEQASRGNIDDFYGDGFYGDEDLSPKEQKKREKAQRKLEKAEAKAAKKAAKKGGNADYTNEPEDYDEPKSGKGRIVLKIILIILIIVLAVEVAGIGIKIFAGQSKAAEFIDTQLNKVIQLITGEDTEYSVIAAQVRTEPVEDKTDLINSQAERNIDNNIKNITYSAELKFDQERDAKISDLVLSQPITQVEWGRDGDNYPVYYDEQVIGEIIEFESRKVNLMNSGDEAVLNMIRQDSKLYKQTAKLKNKKIDGNFEKLEIGEITQAGSNYYVWVRETIGDNTTEKVYSMYPEKQFEMKMAACHII